MGWQAPRREPAVSSGIVTPPDAGMSLTTLAAISPVDGRYASRCTELRAIFSESGLIRARVRVEVAWLQALAGPGGLAEMRGLSSADLAFVAAVATQFG